MDNQQVPMFKEWFIDTYPEIKDYLDLTYFDVEKNTFIAKCSYNPDSGNAAKVLQIAFGSWQHQQAKVEEVQQENLRLAYGNTSYYNQAVKQNEIIDELQKRVDSLEKAEFTLARIRSIVSKNLLESILIKEVRQALKGEGCQ